MFGLKSLGGSEYRKIPDNVPNPQPSIHHDSIDGNNQNHFYFTATENVSVITVSTKFKRTEDTNSRRVLINRIAIFFLIVVTSILLVLRGSVFLSGEWWKWEPSYGTSIPPLSIIYNPDSKDYSVVDNFPLIHMGSTKATTKHILATGETLPPSLAEFLAKITRFLNTLTIKNGCRFIPAKCSK